MTKLSIESPKVQRQVRARVPHGCRPEMAVTVYHDGIIGLREAGRPQWTEQRLDVGQLYTKALLASAARAQARQRQLVKDGMTRKAARRKARREAGLSL